MTNQDNTVNIEEATFEEFDIADLVEQSKQRLIVKMIIKPCGTGGHHFKICNRMGLWNDSTWYADIVVNSY